jgi:large repetitive protein
MTPGFGRTGGRAKFAFVCLGIAVIFGAVLGCVGAGDDSLSPTVPAEAGHDGATDAGTADAVKADGPHEGSSQDGGDATVSGGEPTDGGPPEGGPLDGGDGHISAEDAGRPISSLSASAIDFAAVNCGAIPATKTLTINNTGAGPLSVSAMTTAGAAFAVSPLVLNVPPGASGTLTVTATVPATATAGAVIQGSLNVFTNDPNNLSLAIPLSVTPTGASLVLSTGQTASTTAVSFPSAEPGTTTTPQTFSIVNQGNAPADFSLAAPSSMLFTVSPSAAGNVVLNPGSSWMATATFSPKDTSPASLTLAVTTTGTTCGVSLSTVQLSGQGVVGTIQGWPTATPPAAQPVLDFGPANCGGAAPAPQTFTLTNVGSVDSRLLMLKVVDPNDVGFNVSSVGRLTSGGGTLAITVTAPAVPAPAPGSPAIDVTTPLSATLNVQTDADTSPHAITLQEEPTGAILQFDTSPTAPPAMFGSFSSTVLLQQSPPQAFNVKNVGNAPASVTLAVTANGLSDAGADSGTDAASDATTDGSVPGSVPPQPFLVSPTTFSVQAGVPQAAQVTFTPVVANGNVAQLSTSVASTTFLCAPLPAPLFLAGTGIGGGLSVSQNSISFATTCGGSAPEPQAVILTNNGSADLTWWMGGVVGPGAANYSVSVTSSPDGGTVEDAETDAGVDAEATDGGAANAVATGLLMPQQSATISISAAPIGSPAPNTNPSALAAQLTITTDVPYDTGHVISLGQIPLGDQLSVSVGTLAFGQIPVPTASAVGQTFTVTNNASVGSPAATFSLGIQGAGAGAYTASPSTVTSLSPLGVSNEAVTFLPTNGIAYPGAIAITTTDHLCTALPPPIQLSGTGTAGVVGLSANTLTFGTNPSDPNGLVHCGSTGPAQNLTISNVGNWPFQVSGLTLGLGATSPYAVSGATLPATLGIGQNIVVTLTPTPIPQAVTDPSNASLFSDTLTVTTSAAGDSPHAVSLVMQAQGAIVTATPLSTAWSFGTIVEGSIGTFTSTIQNTGNAPASVALNGLFQPTIFGLQSNPTTAEAGAATAIVGQFSPPTADGAWSDQATLVVTSQAFCAPLPTMWTSPTISLSGASTGAAAVVISSGDFSFPTTECGSPAPAGQAVTLQNNTNQTYALTLAFNSGKYYTVTSTADAGSTTLPAGGEAIIVVTPKTIAPGPGVQPGTAAYADDLLIQWGPGPLESLTIPITWGLDSCDGSF